MRRNIVVEALPGIPVAAQAVELVERKGVGHPDTICDSIMERVSVALSQEYLRRTGTVLHHNIDKAFLVAGTSEVRLGGGRVVEPMRLIFGDRATAEVDGEPIAIEEIAVRTAREWIGENLRFVDPDEHVRYDVEIKPGSDELRRSVEAVVPVANDTSAAVGYWPMTETEQIVLATEQYVNAPAFKQRYPEAGEDVKVMAFRRGRGLELTVALAFVDRFIESEAAYFRRKDEIYEDVRAHLRANSALDRIELFLNTLDQPGQGTAGMYLTVTGTSAENGDSGQVGRGNKVNGVIALNRPMGTEAAAGKNPISHVGKIYTILTHLAARRIYEEVRGVAQVYVWMCSRIGMPVDQPSIAAAQVILAPKARRDRVERAVREILDRELGEIPRLTGELARGMHPVA